MIELDFQPIHRRVRGAVGSKLLDAARISFALQESGGHETLGKAVAPARVRQVGNATGAGARMIRMSMAMGEEAARLAQRIAYLKITGRSDFEERFILSLPF